MAVEAKAKTNVGKITQIVGVVIDVEFSDGNLPSIYNELKVKMGDQ
jgi:F-type H+-transporting ATPase subunit beta